MLVDKPRGWTSHDVVAKLRGITRIKKIGHAGTLDPMATGLLVVGIGKATKRLADIAAGNKTYLATAALGAVSTTDDDEGEITPWEVTDIPGPNEVQQALGSMIGEQLQVPPAYAAIKSGGKKLYELARAGKDVPREPRPVRIESIDLLQFEWPYVTFRTTVSKGTYIRAMARDLGEALDTGGYLTALRRETVGQFKVEDAATIEQLQTDWQSRLIGLD